MKLLERWIAQQDIATVLRAVREAKGYWRFAVLLVVIDSLGTGLVLLSPVPLKIAVDSVLGDAPPPRLLQRFLPEAWLAPGPLLWVAALLLLGIVFLMQLQSMSSMQVRTGVCERITRRFRTRLFSHLQAMPLSELNRLGRADPVYRLQFDAPAIQWIVIGTLVPYVTAWISFIVMLVVVVRIDAWLAFATIAVMPLMVLISKRHRTRMPPLYDALKTQESRAFSIFQQTMMSVRLVKAYGQGPRESQRFGEVAAVTVDQRLKTTLAENLFGMLVNMLTAAATAAVLFLGFSHIQSGRLTVGELLIVITYLGTIYRPLNSVVHLLANMQDQLSSARRCFAFLDKPVEHGHAPESPDSPRSTPRARGHIRFEDVWFRYEEPHVLRGFSLEVLPGQRLGITGETGAGKSTLLDLLLRFQEPEAGRVVFDETDLSTVPVHALRDQIAIAMQEPVLFEGTIADNIAYGSPGASRDAIIEAAKVAHAHGFISRLPHGYDSAVGERGVRLSGGERQRIALARAILRDAPVLLLDEPTSSVDEETERLILDCLRTVTVGRTSIVISHRPSILALCDRVIRVEDGQCRELTWFTGHHPAIHPQPTAWGAATQDSSEPSP